ncbi:hypothetical protein SAMN04488511_11334 [Pedobacter suwonensis]|uniref:6-bladed beta-propeller protein n=1 Tax=Pedobacter suwonensis TaxID=332999 RepID=A0A1I0TQU8_9SPHI|nr:6-bladed beta-propeller [Pedobacter suwonensis]SFA54144.1 hypothetical protein SAMN04488511_11334 [Pedobacter suwonensis]
MNNRFLLTILGFAALLGTSCSDMSKINKRSNLNNALVKNQLVDDKAASPEIIHVDLEKKSARASELLDISAVTYLDNSQLLGKADKVIYSTDRLYVLDKKLSESVFCYDLKGKLVFKLSDKGKAPREFQGLYDITVDNQNGNLLVYDGRKILYYNKDGAFIKEKRYDVFGKNIACLHNGDLIFSTGNTAWNNDLMYNLITVDTTLKITSKNFKLEEKDLKNSWSPWFYMQQRNEEVYYTDYFNDTTFKISNKKISPQFVMDYGKYKVPNGLKQQIATGQMERDEHYIYGRVVSWQNATTFFNFGSGLNGFVSSYYDKRKKKVRSYFTIVDDLFFNALNPVPVGVNGDQMVYSIDPAMLHDLYDVLRRNDPAKLADLSKRPKNQVMMDIIKNTKVDSNPILISANIKESFYE